MFTKGKKSLRRSGYGKSRLTEESTQSSLLLFENNKKGVAKATPCSLSFQLAI
jgi:hypothetical protein